MHKAYLPTILADVSTRRTATEFGKRVRAAIVTRGTDTESVATAVGMRASELEEHLDRGDLSMPDVVRVGGVLRLTPSDLYGDAA